MFLLPPASVKISSYIHVIAVPLYSTGNKKWNVKQQQQKQAFWCLSQHLLTNIANIVNVI